MSFIFQESPDDAKPLVVFLCMKVFLNQLVADVRLSARLVIGGEIAFRPFKSKTDLRCSLHQTP